MQAVLDQAEDEESGYGRQDECEEVEGVPGGDSAHEVVDQYAGDDGNHVPLGVAQKLHKVALEESGGLDEEPVRGIRKFDVGLVIHGPYLRAEGQAGVDHLLHLFFKGSYGHGVGHGDGEGVVEGELLVNFFEVGVPEEEAASGVVGLEGGGVEDEVVVQEQQFILFLCVVLDFFKIFESEVVV